MTMTLVRKESIAIAERRGVEIIAHLPLLEDNLAPRAANEVLDRFLTMHVASAVAYGFNRSAAMEWLTREKIDTVLTPNEAELLAGAAVNSEPFRRQVEGIWAFGWVLGFVPALDFWSDCSGNFVTMLPNLKQGESGVAWRNRARLRPPHDIIAATDLAYCLHWAARDAQLQSRHTGFKSHVVEERRRALDWVMSDDDWDEISLDT